MAKNTEADLSVTPGNNTDILSQVTSGSANANTIDTIFQNILGVRARTYGDLGGLGTVGGSANAITLTSLSTYQALTTGLRVRFKAASTNTSTVTLNLDGLGAKAARFKGDTALAAGQILANGYYDAVYDTALNAAAGGWMILNPEYQTLDADLTLVAAAGVAAFSGLLYGLTLSNGTDATNDIDIAAGIAIDSTNAKFMALAAGITKRLDAAWAVGTGNGGLDTGSIANTTYHMWLIMRSDTGVVDVLFSASASSPTMPANYDYKRRIGSIVRTGGAIKGFVQFGDDFVWKVQASDISATNPGTSAVTATLTIPTGLVLSATTMVSIDDDAPSTAVDYLLVTPLAITDTSPSSNAFTCLVRDNGSAIDSEDSAVLQVHTDTSGRIRYRLSRSNADIRVSIQTIGWIDTRGRLG